MTQSWTKTEHRQTFDKQFTVHSHIPHTYTNRCVSQQAGNSPKKKFEGLRGNWDHRIPDSNFWNVHLLADSSVYHCLARPKGQYWTNAKSHIAYREIIPMVQFNHKQGVALAGRDMIGPPCSVGRPTADRLRARPTRPPAAFPRSWRPSRPPAALQTTTTASKTILAH